MGNTIEESGAFVHTFTIEPTGDGPLNGLTFAVKDLIDITGQKTGCGNPRWHETHPPAAANAICVELLLAGGGRCIGKTITDELAYSLIGENHFYGTPLNPRATDRVPGGSSCGSASAVACGLADFALGTDTGGSVRVPASNCGLWGFRPTHGAISVAGVRPLSPSFDTVGILAANATVLSRAASVLLSHGTSLPAKPGAIHLIREAFDAVDPDISALLLAAAEPLSELGTEVRTISVREIDGAHEFSDLSNWYEIYRVLQRAEAWCELGGWIESEQPELGSMIRESLDLAKTLDRTLIPAIQERRENYFRKMKAFLGKRDLICIPTAGSVAPRRGTVHKREQAQKGYYFRTLSLTSIAGVARLPQISMPLANANGVPAGISLIAARGEDAFLCGAAEQISNRFFSSKQDPAR